MSPGADDSNKMLLTQTCTADYENLCRLDVLGLEDLPTNDQDMVYTEFPIILVVGTRQGYPRRVTTHLYRAISKAVPNGWSS